MACPVRILFHTPRIPHNTGATMRLSAVTGAELHLAGPLGFQMDDTRLKRAGLDYHDMARCFVHEHLEAAYAALLPARVFAFTAQASTVHTDIDYRAGDVLLFGPEPSGLEPEVLADRRVTERVRIPMLANRRSLNLSNATSIVLYEAWRQHGFVGAG